MTQPNPSTAMARAVIDELSRCGIRLVVISPGSRSAALAIAASEHGEIETRVILDERSAAFYAMGSSKASGRPAAVVCTSGTAVANFMPAVVESSMSLAPLVVVSADRPAELHGVGANQTIDQAGLFGGYVRMSVDLDAPGLNRDGNEEWRSTVCRLVDAAMGVGGRPGGPVHINLAFREPTVPIRDDGRTTSDFYPFSIEGRPGQSRWENASVIAGVDAGLHLPATDRGIVIAGDGRYDREGLERVASSQGWPVIATAASGLRGSEVIGAYEWMLAGGVPRHLRPEVTFVVGGIGPSRRLEELASSATRAQVRIDAAGRTINPSLSATAILVGDPVATLESAATPVSDEAFSVTWARAQDRVSRAVSAVLGALPTCGPGVANALNDVSWEMLVAGSSLPIRDIDSTLARSGRLIANRGASGIDGLVSTALGASCDAGATVALVGDLSLLHDSNGLLISEGHDLVLVVVNNGGGGLFDLLPQARHAPAYEELFVARQDRDLAGLASFHSIEHVLVDDDMALRAAVSEGLSSGGVHLVEVIVDRAADLEARGQLDEVGLAALGSVQA